MGPVGRVVKGGVHDVRLMSRGFRWGRRSQVPRSAEGSVPAKEQPVFRTDWSRSRPVFSPNG